MRHLIALLAVITFFSSLHAQDKLAVTPRKLLHDYLLECCKEHFDARRKEIAALKTPEDVHKRQAYLKTKFLESIGPFPEKTPLNGQVVGTLKGDGFRVEKVIFESRPNHHVTANLYLPDAKGPVPGVIVPCGHSANGKAYDGYQRACILLAKNGIAAFCYDPIGQGERRQLLTDDGKPGIPSMTNEHTLVSIGGWLVGQGTASYRIWDGIRAIDYLVSRPEIDAKKIGCCGNSGGGTMTAYLMALDDRIACAVPSCYITSLEKLFATIGPQDGEQNIVGQVAFGMEHADYLFLRAPKPTLLAVATQDFFNIDGAWTTFREASLVYSKLGHSERVALMEYDDKHGFSKPRREATVRWMRRWLLGVDDAIVEEKSPVFTDAELQCTRSGQVLSDFKGVSAFHLNVKTFEAAKGARDEFAKLPAEQFREGVRKAIGIGERRAKVRTTSNTSVKSDVRVNDLQFRVDFGVTLTGKIGLPRDIKEDEQFIVLPENRPAIGLSVLAGKFVSDERVIYDIDLRGMGSPTPKGAAYFSHDFGDAMLGLHLNRPLLGQRVEDVLATIESWGKGDNTYTIVAEGITAPVALHAAAIEPRFHSVIIENGVVSFESIVRTPESGKHLVSVVPGALLKYDLPQLAASLAPRPLTLRGMVDASGKAMSVADVEAVYQVARQAYERAGAAKNFRIEAK